MLQDVVFLRGRPSAFESDLLDTFLSRLYVLDPRFSREPVRCDFGHSIAGALQGLILVCKGLPLAYSKDLQEDKALVFTAFDDLELAIEAMAGMAADLSFHREALEDAAGEAYSDATDLADWTVRELGLPFRDAHHVSGAIVKAAEAKGVALSALPLEDFQTVEPRIDARIFDVLSARASMESRTSFGGTSPARVREQCAALRNRLQEASR
jgi:argininosuccinate lyase